MKLLNIFTNILVLSSMAVSVACNETEERGSEARTINAVIVQPDTRTSLNGPDANGVYKTVWSPGDQIMVFSGDLACRYILKSGENTNKGVFEGYGNSDDLVAVYPCQSGSAGLGRLSKSDCLKFRNMSAETSRSAPILCSESTATRHFRSETCARF